MFFQSGVGQPIQHGIAEAQANTAWDRWKNSLTRGPLLRAQGLEAAGINRILAAGGGIGATNAGSVIQAKSSGGAGGGPGKLDPVQDVKLARAATKAAEEQANKLAEEAGLAQTNNSLRTLELPHAQALAEFYATDLGKATLRGGEINRALPTTTPSALIRGAAGAAELFRRFIRPSDPNQGGGIVPRHNR